jgi:serine/threonine-protein kinase RsbW
MWRRIPAKLASLEAVAVITTELATEAGLDAHDTYRLRLIADELVTNTIVHAPGDGDGWIGVGWAVRPGAVELLLCDDAPSFDPTVLPGRPDLTAPLERRPIGGLGLLLVHRAADELCYERVDGRNRVTAIVRRGGGHLIPTESR